MSWSRRPRIFGKTPIWIVAPRSARRASQTLSCIDECVSGGALIVVIEGEGHDAKGADGRTYTVSAPSFLSVRGRSLTAPPSCCSLRIHSLPRGGSLLPAVTWWVRAVGVEAGFPLVA